MGKRKLPPCHNNLTTALLTDTYQVTMAYAYWRNNSHLRPAVFDLLFRKSPFSVRAVQVEHISLTPRALKALVFQPS